MQIKSFEPQYFHGSVVGVDICKFISNLRKPLFFLNVFHFQSYPLRDLYSAHGKFTWVCWTVSFIFYTLVLFLSKGEQHTAFFCTLILVLFPKHYFENRNILSQTCQVFFSIFLNDSWNFTSCTEYFYLIKEVDMDFPAAQNWQQKTNFFSWFSETSIQWVCLALFMCQ